MLLKSQTIKKLTDLDHLSSLKRLGLLNWVSDPNIDYFEPEDIDYIRKVLEREHIGDGFKLYQAFYRISDTSFAIINISIVLSPGLNLAFISSCESDSNGNIGEILAWHKHFKEKNYNLYYRCMPPLLNIDAPLEVLGKKWVSFIKLDEKQVAEFVTAISQIELQTMGCIAWIGSIEFVPWQEGRVIESPDTVYRFCSYNPFIDVANPNTRDYFRYFVFLLLFFQKHSRNKIAHNVINILLAHYRNRNF